MSRHPAELISVALPLSHRAPPSGKAMRERLLLRLSDDAMVEALARLSGRSIPSVAWLLKQDMIVPGGLLRAAMLLEADKPRS
ncbi:hypothetical protein OIU35_13540 [Boseaceae bacterium BT-24-1]|nr:hypothetical protein [Boseaceae bacterium BT-24-1]